MRMKVLITGSRRATPVMLAKALEVVQWCQAQGHAVIVGDASGVDHAVREACAQLHVPVKVYGAYGRIREEALGSGWEERLLTHGSYPEHDAIMAQRCDVCVAIMKAPRRHGTYHTGKYAEGLGKRVMWRVFRERF
jgi:hypothetical protein